MSTFSNLLEEYMKQNEIHISKLSQLAEMDRTVVYRYVKGTRVPSSIETVNVFSDVLCLSNKERDILVEAWECEVWGKEMVGSYKQMHKMLVNLQECNTHRRKNRRIYMNEKICDVSGNVYLSSKEEIHELIFDIVRSVRCQGGVELCRSK